MTDSIYKCEQSEVNGNDILELADLVDDSYIAFVGDTNSNLRIMRLSYVYGHMNNCCRCKEAYLAELELREEMNIVSDNYMEARWLSSEIQNLKNFTIYGGLLC